MPELSPIRISFLLFPNVTQLDLTGPAQVLSRLGNATIDLVAKTREPVPTDAGFALLPTATFADFTALATLPKVRLKINSKTEHKGADAITTVSVENSSKALAFFVRLKVNQGAKGKEILPVIWQDNYFSLLPGEKREVSATYRAEQLGAAQPSIEVTGWNVEK